MRNPRESWAKSDSVGETVGPEDLRLMRTLVRRGGSHRKFLRMISVWCDMTLPRFAWVDLDTYKVGTVKNCQSSSYVLGSRWLTQDDFERPIRAQWLEDLHQDQESYFAHKSAANLHALKCNLPEGFLQTATICMNYEVALAIYRDRKSHILPEFSGPGGICEMILGLPHMAGFVEATK
jgi:hypothetical protein